MKDYLKMSNIFEGKIVSEFDCLADYSGEPFGEVECRYAAHAINSHDELVQMNKELLAALEGLLSDMRLRAELDGDVDSEGCVVLNCGNGVLYAANQAIEKAKAVS